MISSCTRTRHWSKVLIGRSRNVHVNFRFQGSMGSGRGLNKVICHTHESDSARWRLTNLSFAIVYEIKGYPELHAFVMSRELIRLATCYSIIMFTCKSKLAFVETVWCLPRSRKHWFNKMYKSQVTIVISGYWSALYWDELERAHGTTMRHTWRR